MDAWTAYAVLELVFLIVKVWALVLCLRYPQWAWAEAGHARAMWLLLLVLGLFLPILGWLLAVWFLFSTAPSVRRASQLGARPGFPGRT